MPQFESNSKTQQNEEESEPMVSSGQAASSSGVKSTTNSSSPSYPLPGFLKKEFEAKAVQQGIPVDLSDVQIYYNSSLPQQYGKKAFAFNPYIYLSPGANDSLRHELIHIIQQKQGRAKANGRTGDGKPLNTDTSLEKEAIQGWLLPLDLNLYHIPSSVTSVVQFVEEDEEEQKDTPVLLQDMAWEIVKEKALASAQLVIDQFNISEELVAVGIDQVIHQLLKKADTFGKQYGAKAGKKILLKFKNLGNILGGITVVYNILTTLNDIYLKLPVPIRVFIKYVVGRMLSSILPHQKINVVMANNPITTMQEYVEALKELITAPVTAIYNTLWTEIKKRWEIDEKLTFGEWASGKMFDFANEQLGLEPSSSKEIKEEDEEEQEKPKDKTLFNLGVPFMDFYIGNPEIHKWDKDNVNEEEEKETGGAVVDFGMQLSLMGKSLKANDNQLRLPWDGNFEAILENVALTGNQDGSDLFNFDEVFSIKEIIFTKIKFNNQGLNYLGVTFKKVTVANKTFQAEEITGIWSPQGGFFFRMDDMQADILGKKLKGGLFFHIDNKGKFKSAGLSLEMLSEIALADGLVTLKDLGFEGSLKKNSDKFEVAMKLFGGGEIGPVGDVIKAKAGIEDAYLEYDNTAEDHWKAGAGHIEMNISNYLTLGLEETQLSRKGLTIDDAYLLYDKTKEEDKEEESLDKSFGNLSDVLNAAPIELLYIGVKGLEMNKEGLKMAPFSKQSLVRRIKMGFMGFYADLDFEKKKGLLGGQFNYTPPFLPFNLAMDIPIPGVPGLELTGGLAVLGNLHAGARVELAKDQTNKEEDVWVINGNINLGGTAGLEGYIGLSLGSGYIVAISALVFARAMLPVDGNIEVDCTVKYNKEKHSLELVENKKDSTNKKNLKLNYSVEFNPRMELGGRLEARAFYFFRKTIAEYTFASWSPGKYTIGGELEQDDKGKFKLNKKNGKNGFEGMNATQAGEFKIDKNNYKNIINPPKIDQAEKQVNTTQELQQLLSEYDEEQSRNTDLLTPEQKVVQDQIKQEQYDKINTLFEQKTKQSKNILQELQSQNQQAKQLKQQGALEYGLYLDDKSRQLEEITRPFDKEPSQDKEDNQEEKPKPQAKNAIDKKIRKLGMATERVVDLDRGLKEGKDGVDFKLWLNKQQRTKIMKDTTVNFQEISDYIKKYKEQREKLKEQRLQKREEEKKKQQLQDRQHGRQRQLPKLQDRKDNKLLKRQETIQGKKTIFEQKQLLVEKQEYLKSKIPAPSLWESLKGKMWGVEESPEQVRLDKINTLLKNLDKVTDLMQTELNSLDKKISRIQDAMEQVQDKEQTLGQQVEDHSQDIQEITEKIKQLDKKCIELDKEITEKVEQKIEQLVRVMERDINHLLDKFEELQNLLGMINPEDGEDRAFKQQEDISTEISKVSVALEDYGKVFYIDMENIKEIQDDSLDLDRARFKNKLTAIADKVSTKIEIGRLTAAIRQTIMSLPDFQLKTKGKNIRQSRSASGVKFVDLALKQFHETPNTGNFDTLRTKVILYKKHLETKKDFKSHARYPGTLKLFNQVEIGFSMVARKEELERKLTE